jgi:hypothetical protein
MEKQDLPERQEAKNILEVHDIVLKNTGEVVLEESILSLMVI